METDTEIYFYSHNSGKYYCFSNFFPIPFTENGITFNCSEQYFMYKKCLLFNPTNHTLLNQILAETNPTKIKLMGRAVSNYSEFVWQEYRVQIMTDALMLKFTQNPELEEMLLETANKTIYEASKFDRIWGIGYSVENALKNKHKFGQNLLGKCLMDVRSRIRK